MRKVLSLILSLIILVSMTSVVYAWEYPYEQVELKATVITCRYNEATDKFSFCAVGDVYGNGGNEPFTFGISRENLIVEEGIDELEIGRVITVLFNGEVMESYPMQIVADVVFAEDEIKELTENEKLSYLSMFYTDEWISDNGYAIVIECDEDTAPPSEIDEEDDGGFVPDYDTDEYDCIDGAPMDEDELIICGVPLEGDDKCVTLTEHYLEGFVVGTEFSEPEYLPGQTQDLRGTAYIYFFAYSNFDTKQIAPVLIELTEGRCALLGVDFWEIDCGMKLKIYCSYDSICVPVEGQRYYSLDGEVLTIEKLDGFEENSNDYAEYFWEISETVYSDDTDIDTDDGGFVPDYDTEKYDYAPIDVEIVEKKNEFATIAVIAISIAVTAAAVLAGIMLLKKK